MDQTPESTREKVGEDIPSPVESLLSNKTVIFAVIVFIALLFALLAGILIGIAIFKKTAKEITPAQPYKQAAMTAPVYKPISSAAKNIQRETPAAKGDEKRAPAAKRHGKKVAKVRKNAASGQVAQISSESVKKTLQAAKEGNAEAQYRLGSMYAKGSGVKKDMGEAYRWYRRAASQGHAKAREAMEFVYE